MEESFISSLSDLTGKVALVTGGAAGIGLETTIYLARQGATVYAASRNAEKSALGIASAKRRLNGLAGDIRFHQLDLSSVRTAAESAVEFGKREGRLDILICNAGISMMTARKLSPDGFERQFATNHLGHFAFVEGVLGLLERTAGEQGDARVVVVSSDAHRAAPRIDYKALETAVESDGTSYLHLAGAFKRYGTSKLANIYYTVDLDRRLRARGVNNVYCNAIDPGVAGSTGLGAGTDQTIIGPRLEKLIRWLTKLFSNSTEDCAKTQTYLAASAAVTEGDIRGQYWRPKFSWTFKYKSCARQPLGPLASDEEEQRKLLELSQRELRKWKVEVDERQSVAKGDDSA
ncbi:MAG: hypothetical protein M1814_000460 [Vezdaea aestivalis]|nr:MAG: hypothetical protein M1814_000460 [Vezdaea aestivalis]